MARGNFPLKVETGDSDAGWLSLLLRHRQQAVGRDTLVRHDAEEPARRHAGIVREHLKMATGGKPLPRLPVIDSGHRNAQVHGDFLQGDIAS